jgi:phytoene dehydrogenase-like protein
MAREGMDVLVVERRHVIGGAAVTGMHVFGAPNHHIVIMM